MPYATLLKQLFSLVLAPALWSAQHSCELECCKSCPTLTFNGWYMHMETGAMPCLALHRHPMSDMLSLLLAKWYSCLQRWRYGVCFAEHGSADAAGACRAEG